MQQNVLETYAEPILIKEIKKPISFVCPFKNNIGFDSRGLLSIYEMCDSKLSLFLKDLHGSRK